MAGLKVALIMGILIVFVAAHVTANATGMPELKDEQLRKAANLLENSILRLASGEGPKYRVSKVISAVHPNNNENEYSINAELINAKNENKKCVINIKSQPDVELGIECEGEPKIVKKIPA
ncbi:sarcocystatin-A-like [Teleopsis dalmanni]|uniref:sarcocystatin-A-like n=1 Tax=Teleopsis dalmanni TaxID=139649 RepID=UPI0018CFBDE7|nr:sarcocystatin-A-like [Teleopsis dalmanni]